MKEFSNLKDRIPVIAVFDIGKTNKKLFLFDESYNVVYEQSQQLKETIDEDGFPCEDIHLMTHWVKESFALLQEKKEFDIKAVNVSAYGASLVHLDQQQNIIGHLTNYLKPYPEKLLQGFLDKYDTDNKLQTQTSSPLLGNLNSGLQLYHLKHERPAFYEQIKYSLHLPQYISFLLTGKLKTEYTSLGCHTLLWDFEKKTYHNWIHTEGITSKFPSINHASQTEPVGGSPYILSGIGLHDSSSALIPYLKYFDDPFVLISTGTWSISLNPFNDTPLTEKELKSDCLHYLSFEGKPVKAARLFAGHDHEMMVNKIASHFNVSPDYYHKLLKYDPILVSQLENKVSAKESASNNNQLPSSGFDQRDTSQFNSLEEAYHQLLIDIVRQQIQSTNLVLTSNIKNIYVDGGFSSNNIYMNLLVAALPTHKIYGASISYGSALGAALVIDKHWNTRPMPNAKFGFSVVSSSLNN